MHAVRCLNERDMENLGSAVQCHVNKLSGEPVPDQSRPPVSVPYPACGSEPPDNKRKHVSIKPPKFLGHKTMLNVSTVSLLTKANLLSFSSKKVCDT